MISENKNCPNIQKTIKYILIGLIVVLATRYIPQNTVETKELMVIGAIASITFAILDMVSPSIQINKKTIPQAYDSML
jgi:hypothetical protein